MLKHLPEGLTPFEDCGFARHPFRPLAGEQVQVDCRVDAGDGLPRLRLWVNGREAEAPAALRRDERHFRFDLGAFATFDCIDYQISTGCETSRRFSFQVEEEATVDRPLAVLRTARGVCLEMEGFVLLLEQQGSTLVQTACQAPAPAGQRCQDAVLPLPDHFALHVGGTDSLWELKRFSDCVCAVHSFTVRKTSDGRITRITQHGTLHTQYVWGTGERFDHVNQQGHGSNGRVVEKFTRQGDQTYLPMPFFMTEQHLGWWCEGSISTEMDFHNGFTLCRAATGEKLSQDVLFFGDSKALLAQFLGRTGQPVLPPEWAFGVWISANGWNSDAEVDQQLQALREYDYPADVMVLEAWSDEMTFYRWNDAQHWQDPAQTVKRIREHGLHLILWQIPIVKYEWDGEPNEWLQRDIEEAIRNKYCVCLADGTPYRITENWFHHSLLLDFTNPQAVKWWFDKRKYLLDMGVEGFKTDGGEFLFDYDAKLHNGQGGLEAHNLYPGQYIGAYHAFLAQNGVDGLTFSRADYAGAQTRPMHWAGDQLSQWSELSAQLTAGISAGLSGVLFWGFDIGGFAGELPSAELYLRATAMACFCPVMQWHAEPRSGQFFATHGTGFVNDRSPWNLARQLKDERVLTLATAFARLRQRLRPYLYKEARHCVTANRPLMAHLCMDFGDDPVACACEDAYMLGRKLLVAPITREGQRERAVYLPAGRWRHYFTQEIFHGQQTCNVNVPLDQIAVFERLDA